MDAEEQKEYDEMFATLATPGWKHMEKRFQEAYDLQNQVLNIANDEVLYKAQGRLMTLWQFLNMEEMLEQEHMSREEESKFQDDEVNILE